MIVGVIVRVIVGVIVGGNRGPEREREREPGRGRSVIASGPRLTGRSPAQHRVHRHQPLQELAPPRILPLLDDRQQPTHVERSGALPGCAVISMESRYTSRRWK